MCLSSLVCFQTTRICARNPVSRLQALLKDLTASKLELESKLQDKDVELKQTQARAVLNGQRAVYARVGFERDLLLCLEASLKAELDVSLKDNDSKLKEALAALQLLEAWDTSLNGWHLGNEKPDSYYEQMFFFVMLAGVC